MSQQQYTASANFGKDKEIVNRFISVYERSTRKQRAILSRLWWFNRNKTSVYPGQSYLAKESGCCREYVNRCLKKWHLAGIVSSRRRAYRTNEYFLHEALQKLNLMDSKLFTKLMPGLMHNPSDNNIQFQERKGHNTDHKEGHHSSSSHSGVSGYRKETVDGRPFSSVDKEEERKRKVLQEIFIKPYEKDSLMKYSARAIERSIADLLSYEKLYKVDSWIRFLDSHCQVYTMCEQMNIKPGIAWDMYKQKKATSQNARY